MTKKNLKKLVLFVVLLAAFAPVKAKAQSIDYASLETLFGEPVTTSASGKPQRVSEAPVDMQIITADDIRRSGAKNIPEALRGVPGVNVLQSDRQDYDVSVHGYIQPYAGNLLVLVNGRQVYLDDYGYTNWAAIPVQLKEIRQIEIVKGPNTALFGFNAADGVINIVTLNPLYDNTSNIGGTVGTGSYREASLVKALKINDTIGLRLSAGASRSHDFSNSVNTAEPSSVFTQPEKRAVNIDSLFQVTPKSQLRFEASSSEVHQTDMTSFSFLTEAEYRTDSLKTDYEADTAFGLVKATAYKNWLKTNWSGTVFEPTESADIRSNVSVAQLSDTFKVGVSNTFRLQGEYRHSDASGVIVGPSGSELQEDIFAVSGMWNWAINDKWELTNSARLDRLDLSRSGPIDPSIPLTNANFDRTITRPSYNSGLVWKVTPDDSLRLNTGRGLRMVSLLDFGADVPLSKFAGIFPILQSGNPRNNPMAVTNYELGWDHKIKAIEGAFKTDVFTERTSNAVGTSGSIVACPVPLNGLFPIACTSPGSIVIQGSNLSSSSDFGAEFELKGKFNQNWSWSVNDTVEKIFNHYENPTVNTLALTPVNLTNVHLGYQNGPWEADGFLYYQTRFQQPEPGANLFVPAPLVTIPAHASFSARIGYKVNDATTVAVSGQELQKAKSVTSTALETERQVLLSLDHSF